MTFHTIYMNNRRTQSRIALYKDRIIVIAEIWPCANFIRVQIQDSGPVDSWRPMRLFVDEMRTLPRLPFGIGWRCPVSGMMSFSAVMAVVVVNAIVPRPFEPES